MNWLWSELQHPCQSPPSGYEGYEHIHSLWSGGGGCEECIHGIWSWFHLGVHLSATLGIWFCGILTTWPNHLILCFLIWQLIGREFVPLYSSLTLCIAVYFLILHHFNVYYVYIPYILWYMTHFLNFKKKAPKSIASYTRIIPKGNV